MKFSNKFRRIQNFKNKNRRFRIWLKNLFNSSSFWFLICWTSCLTDVELSCLLRQDVIGRLCRGGGGDARWRHLKCCASSSETLQNKCRSLCTLHSRKRQREIGECCGFFFFFASCYNIILVPSFSNSYKPLQIQWLTIKTRTLHKIGKWVCLMKVLAD